MRRLKTQYMTWTGTQLQLAKQTTTKVISNQFNDSQLKVRF